MCITGDTAQHPYFLFIDCKQTAGATGNLSMNGVPK